MRNESRCVQKFETAFIAEGAAPIVIHILRLDENRDATMVFTDAEGPDAAIVFTPKQFRSNQDLKKADYYTWDNKMFFVYEDILIARDISYIKQKAYQCNVEVTVLDKQFQDIKCGGYFIASLRSYVDVEFQQKINISDKEQPVLVVPTQDWILVGAKIMAGGKPWKVIDFDSITNPGITYISLERDFVQKQNPSVEVQNKQFNYLKAGIEHTITTKDAYFNSSSPLNIKSRTFSKIVFEIPYGLEELFIEYKDEQGNIQKEYFKVEL